MAFDYRSYLNKFLSDYKAGVFTNDSVATVVRHSTPDPHYQLIGIHHLTGNENRGNHNLFMSVVDETGKRINERIEWGWEGQRPNEKANPVVLDKPLNEPDGNISIGKGQVVWARVLGKPSDAIQNVTTLLPDEDKWNTIGHHSYYCAWVWAETTTTPPDDDCAQVKIENDLLKAKLAQIKEIIG